MRQNLKSLAAQHFSALCRLPQPLFDNIAHSGDELAVGGLAFLCADGVAEITVQNVPVAPGPGDFDQVADGPLHPGGGGVEHGCQLGVQSEGDGIDVCPILHHQQDGLDGVTRNCIYRDIGGINVLIFIGLFLL